MIKSIDVALSASDDLVANRSVDIARLAVVIPYAS